MNTETNYIILWYKNGLDYKIRVEDVLLGDTVFSCKCASKEEFNKMMVSLKKEFPYNQMVEMKL